MAILSAILVTFRRTNPFCDFVMLGRRACAFNKILRFIFERGSEKGVLKAFQLLLRIGHLKNA